jgi:hypothetical protein
MDADIDWMADFDKYNQSKLKVGGKREMNPVEEIEQEMKLLNWHKLANEAALKAALIRTRRLRDTDRKAMAVERNREEAQYMQQILEEEQRKPLEVTAEFIREYEQREMVEEQRLETEVNRHIQSLTRLKEQLRQREEVRKRTNTYREKKNLLRMKHEKSTTAVEADPSDHDESIYLTTGNTPP